jgi:hypothetical protein
VRRSFPPRLVDPDHRRPELLLPGTPWAIASTQAATILSAADEPLSARRATVNGRWGEESPSGLLQRDAESLVDAGASDRAGNRPIGDRGRRDEPMSADLRPSARMTSTSMGSPPRCSFARAREASRAASRSLPRSLASSPTCAPAPSPAPTRRSFAACAAGACSRRSSRASSAVRPSAQESRSGSPHTRFAIRRRPGFAAPPATPGWSPSTSATPTSRPSIATRTSPARSSTPRRQ